MNLIQSKIDEMIENAKKQAETIKMYQGLLSLFEGIEFPEKLQVYARSYDDGKAVWVDFNPYWDSESKDLRPIIHSISQKLQLDFAKDKNYDEESLRYTAKLEVNGIKYRIEVSGVVPSTCHVVETEEQLTEDEIEKARQEALNSVKTTKVIRKIICE